MSEADRVHDKARLQDLLNDMAGQEVIYPGARWRPVDESLLNTASGSRGPGVMDIFLYYPPSPLHPKGQVSRYMNWAGFASDLVRLRAERYPPLVWAEARAPLPPEEL